MHKLFDIQTNASISMFYFSFWILLCGLFLFLIPESLFSLFTITEVNHSITRLFGMVLLFLAFYYFMASQNPSMIEFYKWTVYTRVAAVIIILSMIVLQILEVLVVFFVFFDGIGAIWTIFALKFDEK